MSDSMFEGKTHNSVIDGLTIEINDDSVDQISYDSSLIWTSDQNTSINDGGMHYPTISIANGSNYNWNSGIISGNSNLKVDGDAEISGELKIGGKSLTERLDKIEERLAILHPNSELEQRWEQLKSLGEQYRELEKELLEREYIFDQLKR
jgi:hypothetical protein